MNDYQISLLRKLRINYNYTIQEVANLLGVSKAAVSKWENGGDIAIDHLYDLSKIYNISFFELINGKLNDETNEDYWKRNYDLSNYELEEEIDDNNIDIVKDFFKHCNMVKKRFYALLPRWANDELNNDEIDEFNFIKKYFTFDTNYYSRVEGGGFFLVVEEKEKEFTKKIVNTYKDLSNEAYLWEIGKIYNFTYNLHKEEVCKSGNLKALEYMLSTYSQIEKDLILYANIYIEEEKKSNNSFGFGNTQVQERYRTIEEIEQIPFFKIIMNSGANCLYQFKPTTPGWDIEQLNAIDGKAAEIDYSIYKKYRFYNFAGEKYVPILNNWKSFSYEQYLEFIDHNETEKLRDIVNLRTSNPLKYYKRMIERENI